MARGIIQDGYNTSHDLRRTTRFVSLVCALYTPWMCLGCALDTPCVRLGCGRYLVEIFRTYINCKVMPDWYSNIRRIA